MASNCNNIKPSVYRALTSVTYNMHGFNQGVSTIKDLIDSHKVDIFMIQEHWLTPDKLCKFKEIFPDYSGFGISALADKVESGPLIGRPFGGTMILVKNELLAVSECIHTAERFVIVRVGNILFVNVYLPCIGTANRDLISNEIFAEISAWKNKHDTCGCILAGDFNSDLDSQNASTVDISTFLVDNSLTRCDLQFKSNVSYTFSNEKSNHYSKLDYITYYDVHVKHYDVIESSTNLSDHLPVVVVCDCCIDVNCLNSNTRCNGDSVPHLRWDHADIIGYYSSTFCYLQSILTDIHSLESRGDVTADEGRFLVESLYSDIVISLQSSASAHVPTHRTNFYKFWWSQELDCLKEKAIESDKIWKANGRPRSGPIFNKRSADKRAYKAGIRKTQSESVQSYSNDLNDALLSKNGNDFWKCWKSKFGVKSPACLQVNGITDKTKIAGKFRQHFARLSSAATDMGEQNLRGAYENLRPSYTGSPYMEYYAIDAELIEIVISELKRGKAAGLDTLTAEHLQYCHQLLPTVLAKLFNLMLRYGCVPTEFGRSYTVPLQKGDKGSSKSITVDAFAAYPSAVSFLKFSNIVS